MQEGAGQGGLPADPGEAAPQGPVQAGEIGCAHISQVGGLHVAPDLFDRIQLRGIGGQGLHGEPGALAGEVGGHVATLVSAQAIPDQDDPAPAKMPLEGAHERDERTIGIAAGMGLEKEPRSAPIPAKRQRAGHRQAFPVPARVTQDGGVPTRGPGAADYRMLRDAAFVLEDEPGPLAAGVFFSCGQRRCFHSAIAASLRSRACRPGRWSDHPSARSTRQT
jgi:hypothetical protein